MRTLSLDYIIILSIEYKETLFIHEKNNEIKDFSNYENYNEFSSFLAERENQNLNIIIDIEKIKTNLKLGFQHEKQEIFGCILYDDDYKIQNEKFEKQYEKFKETIPTLDLQSYMDFWDNYNSSIRL